MCRGLQSLRFRAASKWGVLVTAVLLAAPVLAARDTQTAFDLGGKRVDPFKASHGKLVVLLFVRTDCPISNRYAPEIQRMSAAHSAMAQFWLVYPDRSETAQQIRAHDKDYGYSLPALRDPEHTLVKASEVTITPEAAVFTTEGRLIYHGRIDDWFVEMGRARSAPTTHDLEEAIETAAKNPKASLPSAQAVGCYISDLD